MLTLAHVHAHARQNDVAFGASAGSSSAAKPATTLRQQPKRHMRVSANASTATSLPARSGPQAENSGAVEAGAAAATAAFAQRHAFDTTRAATLAWSAGCCSEKNAPPRPACDPLHMREHGNPCILRSANVTAARAGFCLPSRGVVSPHLAAHVCHAQHRVSRDTRALALRNVTPLPYRGCRLACCRPRGAT